MFNKYFILGCSLASLFACSQKGLDLGPYNPDFGKTPEPVEVEVIDYDYTFESSAEVEDWRVDDSVLIDLTLSLHNQSTALQIAPTLLTDGWGLDAVGNSESGVMATFMKLDEPRSMQGGRAIISVFLPTFYATSNPWDDQRNDRNSVGFELFIEDALGARENIFGWENADTLSGYRRDPKTIGGDGWFDFDIPLGLVSGLDMTQINGLGLRLTLTDRCLDESGTDHCETTEISQNEQYVYIDSVALLLPPDDYVAPVPVEPSIDFALPIYVDGISDEWADAGFASSGWHYHAEVDWAGMVNVSTGNNSGTVVQEVDGVWKFGQGEPGFDLSPYTEFQFSVYSDDAVSFVVIINEDWTNNLYKSEVINGGQWNIIAVPLSEFSADIETIKTIEVQAQGAAVYPLTYYIDDIGFHNQ